MTEYRAPVDEVRFTLKHIAGLEELTSLPGFEHVETDLVDGIVEEAGRFMQEVIAPINRDGDIVGSVRNDDGTVTVPPGFAEAYRSYVESGWGSLPFPPAYDGGGFPWLVNIAIQDFMSSACLSFSLCPLLGQGAIDALLHYGTEQQKETYLRRMVAGEWTGTMNLTEPDAGSDVGALATKATPAGDGSFRISGQKIFITYGEHEMAENIIHLVLARTPDSPPGTKGISLFVVPKFLVNADGSLGDRNDVSCVSIEHKLGIHASPTCVLSFGDNDGAIGWLVGEEHDGMRAMFTMMNNARLSVAVQGVGLGERAYQQALAFAHERRQGRAPGDESPGPSAIVEHADVQRMLLDMASATAAIRGLCYRNAAAIDRSTNGATPEARKAGEQTAALLTPLSKAWGTDIGCEVTSTGVQIHGGMGFIEETGAAQHFRDIRIAPIYEGTNGIQAMDLVGRKVPMDGGNVVRGHIASLRSTAAEAAAVPELARSAAHLSAAIDAVETATEWLLEIGASDPAARLPGAVPYLEMLAVTTGAEILARGALAVLGTEDAEYRASLFRFFATNRAARVPGILPSVSELGDELVAGRATVLSR